MESPTPVSRFITRNSKNRVFPGGSSSSGFKEVEVLEMPPSPPPINRTSKSKSSKQKAVIYHEIIDVDIEEDSDYIDRSGKGKEALSNFSAGVSNLAIDGSRNDIQMSNNGTVQDLNSNLFYGEDDWIDKYFDDIVFDDYAALQSYFDHMDIPPGVEAPFPWLPSSPQNDIKVPVTGASISSSSQIELNGSNISHDLYSSDSPLPSKPVLFKDLTTSAPSKIGMQAASQNLKGQQYSKRSETGRGLTRSTASSNIGYLTSQPSGSPLPHKPVDEPLLSVAKNKKRSRVYSTHKQFPSGATLQSTVNYYSGYPALSMPSNASGMGTYMPVWPDLPVNVLEPSMGPPVMNGSAFAPSLQDSAYNQNEATSARVEQRNVDEIFQNYDQFKKFDTVEDYSDHYYSKSGSFPKQPPKNWAKKIQEEWKILEKDLPDTIFVRVYESRMDLLRAVIVGAEGTPYHDGLFFFDVCFPSSYPNVPPQVHYHSGGLRINPNLYNCGKVCLSLLNTWSGSQKEKWIPGVSTMLQVLVSIQGLILNAKPYFNEPGYAHSSGTTAGEKKSLDYNENTFMLSLRTMVYNMRRPPKYFEAYVVGHFCKHARDILVSCKAYLDGAQVGCLVKGGVQDVDEGDKSCSQHFRTDLAGFITTLANTFSQIGAKDCQEFLYLSQKANGPATAAPGPINFYH